MLAFGVDRQANKDIGRSTAQILAELGTHTFGKDLKRRAAVELKNEIIVSFRDAMHGTHRLAGLGDANGIGELTGQQCSADGITADRVSA